MRWTDFKFIPKNVCSEIFSKIMPVRYGAAPRCMISARRWLSTTNCAKSTENTLNFLFSFLKKKSCKRVTQSRKNLCDYLTAHTWRRRRVQWCAAQSDLCVIVWNFNLLVNCVDCIRLDLLIVLVFTMQLLFFWQIRYETNQRQTGPEISIRYWYL